MNVEPLTLETKEEAQHFLLEHEDTSLFLLSNLEKYGHKIGSDPYSGNFKLIRSGGKVAGVFCLASCGNLLIQSKVKEFDLVIDACKKENIPIQGLLGEWAFCESLWEHLKARGLIKKEEFVSKETLFTLDLRIQRSILPQAGARLLETEDFEEWEILDDEYRDEQKIPDSMTKTQKQNLFAQMVKEKRVWGLFVEDRLAVKAEFNAKAFDLCQLGGVYTGAGFRQRGLAKSLMFQILHDAKTLFKARKLIIFTGEQNVSAKALYEAIGAKSSGNFALLFGK